VVKTYVS